MIGDQLFVEVEGADVQVAESQDVHMQAPPNAPPAAIAPTPARSVGDRPHLNHRDNRAMHAMTSLNTQMELPVNLLGNEGT